jgi:Protein of unknown function (DUF3618)
MDNQSQSVGIPRGDNAGEDARTREIRAEIEQTREDLSETVEAIQEKLRPSNIAANAAAATTERVKDMAHNAADTAGEWWEASGGNSLIDRLRNNPVPALLTGVGLAWLAFSDGNRRRYPAGFRPERYRPPQEGNQWRDTRHELMESASQMRERSGEMVRRGRHNLELMIRDYPLAVGAAAAVLGATLGMVVPETERENELMGEARDSALERAQHVASDAATRVKEAAADAVTRSVIGE